MSTLLLRNARIWTGVSTAPWADTALVRDGRFAFVGREGDLQAPSDAPALDAGDRLVLPGLVDSHAHLLGTGQAMRSVDLKGAPSVEEAARRVAEPAAATPKGAWVRGAGWDQNLWPKARFPHRRALDDVSPDHPVALIHTSGHCVWVNSAALHAAGVTASTEAPAGGAIDRDESGAPSGILRDAAAGLIYDAMPSTAPEERIDSLRDAIAHAHSLGVTGVHAMDVGRGELDALRALADDGALQLRTRVYLAAGRLDEWIEEGMRTGDGDAWLSTGGVKFFADGALGSLTAWMLEPYEGSDDTGLPFHTPSELEKRVRSSLENGLGPAIHAIGDRANREALDVLERTQGAAPDLARRIEHAQLLSASDLPRFAALNVTASVQPIHATQDMAKVDRAWGSRGRLAYPFASLLARGVNLAFGSDSPVETMNPPAGIHAAVTRRNAEGVPDEGWYPEERISLERAIDAYTAGPARLVGESAGTGRIAAGCHADFVLLSEDLFALSDQMRILDARVDVTVVGGEIVYRRTE